ncbi:MAG: NADH-quinone oxidoreductase subunit M [Planctomycetota bacterium]
MSITLTLLIPVATAILLLCIPKDKTAELRMTALFGSLATLAFSLALLGGFDAQTAGFQFTEKHEWVPSLGIHYHVGIDGISLFLVVLSALLTPIAILCSWKSVEKRVREFHIALLLLTSGVIGVFVALDLMLFYVFWEVMLIPMYLLVGIWGSTERIRAAVKFFIYTMAGSLLMFLAILYLYQHTGTFSVEEIYDTVKKNPVPGRAGMFCFLAFALSFAIKIPLFPVHTWLPDAHTEAPTAGSVILAGVFLKLGIYGFIRFAIPFFPADAALAAPWISILAIIGIIFGALMCFVQEDMKRLIAYSSVSHMGFIVLGLFAFNEQGVQGCVLQMVNHGISTGALFLLIGAIYERRHTRRIIDFGGLAPVAPRLAIIFFITTLSSIGLPFLNGFVGEFLILQGAYSRNVYYAAFAGLGIILGAVYMLTLYRRIFFGETDLEENAEMKDLDGRELAFLLPLVGLMVFLGLFSPWFTSKIQLSIVEWLKLVQAGGG